MEKKFLSKAEELSIEYLPPRLVEAGQGWYIVFYQVNPATGELERERKSYDLNRLKLPERKKRAAALVKEIARLMPGGYPWVASGKVFEIAKYKLLKEKELAAKPEKLPERSVLEALTQATNAKIRDKRKDTVRTFESRSRHIVNWLAKERLSNLPLSEFTKKHAQAYLNEARERVCGTTYNNYRREAIGFWEVMLTNEWIESNPWKKTVRMKKSKKRRRKFELDEAAAMLDYLYENDWWLLILVLLHLGGCLRRTEAYRLRFRDFNLVDGYIHISEDQAKNWKEAPITIPGQILHFLRDERFSAFPLGWLLFGQHCKPHPNISTGENTFKNRHRKALLLLQKQGRVADIEGLSLYSWKDTGLSALAKFLTPFELKDQARHADTATTMIYYEGERIIENAKTAKLPMLEGITERLRGK